jgi:hypothetical protein
VPATPKPAVPATPAVVAKPAAPAAAAPSKLPSSAPLEVRLTGTHDRETTYLKALIYGAHGVGKTHLLGTSALVPEMDDVIIFDMEAGHLTLKKFPNIARIQIRNFRQLSRAYEFMVKHCKLRDDPRPEAENALRLLEARLRGVDAKTIVKPKRFRTLIFDSVSELEEYTMDYTLGFDSAEADFDTEPGVAEWPEFRKNLTTFGRVIRCHRNLPVHFLATCAMATAKGGKKSPRLTGQLSDRIQGVFDVVGYYAKVASADGKKRWRRLFLEGGPTFDAKCRLEATVNPHIDNPTVGALMVQAGLVTPPTKGAEAEPDEIVMETIPVEAAKAAAPKPPSPLDIEMPPPPQEEQVAPVVQATSVGAAPKVAEAAATAAATPVAQAS